MVPNTRISLLWLLCWFKWSSSIEIPQEAFAHEKIEQPPTITEQSPKMHIVYRIDDYSIKCEARGNPPPTFHWTKDGKDYDPSKDPRVDTTSNSGTFIIKASNGNVKSFQGKYRCYASNSRGTAISEEIEFITAPIPRFPKETIAPIQVEEGMSVVLPCDPPNGAPPLNIYWMTTSMQRIEQDGRVSQGLNGDLYFSNVLASDDRADYFCLAQFTRARNIVQKEPIRLIVKPFVLPNDTESHGIDLQAANSIENRGPRLLSPSGSVSSVMALRGDSLQLECIAEGLPTPEVFWIKLDGEMPEHRVRRKNFNKTLEILNITELDHGKYQCKATNPSGSVTHSFSVTVEAAPYWIKKPENKIAVSKENAQIVCEVGGHPQPGVHWKVNGKLMNETKPIINRKVSQNLISLTNLQLNDSAVYQCEASNKHGSILVNAFVNVLNLAPMMLTPDNQDYIAVEGKVTFLHCKVFGSPAPTVFWLKEDMETALEGPRYKVHENGTLEIVDVWTEDAGFYTCWATNSLGNDTTSGMLEVRAATRIVHPPEDLVIKRSNTAQLKCHAVYDSAFKRDFELSWKKDGEEIYVDQTENDRIFIEDDILQIINVDEDDEGTYTCVARTPLDSVMAEAKLTVLDIPESPEGLELSDSQDRSIRLTWKPGNSRNSPITEFIVEYEDNLFEAGRWHPRTTVSGNETSVLLHLSPYMNYQFRVSALNRVGKSKPSAPSKRYLTKSAVPEKNPINVKGEGTEPHNMRISWEPLKPIDWNGPGLKYQVSWRQKEAENPWNHSTVNKHHHIVDNTPTFVPYDIKVQALNDLGPGPEPKIATGYSGEDLPEDAPMNVALEVMNSTVIKVTWSEVQKEKIRGHLEGYKIVYWKIKSLLERRKRHLEKHVLTFSGERSHGMVPGLEPYSKYRLAVMVFNRKGNGPESAPIHFDTPEGVPEQPAFLRITGIAKDAVTLMWGPPIKPNGILIGYLLQYQLINDTDEIGSLKAINITNSTVTKLTVSDLDTSSKYKFYLSACTKAGPGKLITEEGITVMEGAYAGIHGGISTQGWFIGLMCAIALLTLILLIACFIKRNKGGKYSVKDKEDARADPETQPMKEETFGEYSDNEDRPLKGSQQSLTEDVKPTGSDDSLAKYGEGGSEGQFNEDGSFIGQYSGNKENGAVDGNESSTATSPVNA
ncbi:neural cell adhesion molecule L1-like protein isoform X2 [Callorhinchus milii]|uniref:neural cell adhesion molecule L1-like protein isoform X2 n=1 Tax=Callorhinchus milii TaxID=7868 RepID=UPI001C3F7FD3|nr:neural cell adhesion molecule L1-like protein isoform X2 [Callorhinchus milii]